MIKNLTTKSLLALLITVSVIVGCSDDDEVALNKCFVTKISSDEYETTFTYTSDNKVSSGVSSYTDNGQTFSETSTITYDSKGNLTKSQETDSYSTYTYNDNNQAIREDYYEDDVLDDRTDYEYNSSGQLIKSQFYSVSSSGVATKGGYEVYTYSSTTSKNPLTEKQYSPAGDYLYYSKEYQFDDKNTWSSSLGLGVVFSEIAAAENNVTKEIRKDDTGKVLSTTTYAYEYNDKGYPTKVTSTEVFNGGSESFTINYVYNCK